MQYFKEYLYNVKLNNLLIGGENKLEKSTNKVDKYLLDIYENKKDEAIKIINNIKNNDTISY